MRKINLVIIASLAALFLQGCTTSTPSSEYTQVISRDEFDITIPISWQELGSNWLEENTIGAFGDSAGETNTQSIIINKYSNFFDPNTEDLDNEFCERQYQLKSSEDIFSQPNDTYQLRSVRLFESKNQRGCEISYTYNQDNQNVIEFYDKLYIDNSDIYYLSGSLSEGLNQSDLQQAVNSFNLK